MKETHRSSTVAALALAMFMSAMEATVVSTAMPTVVAELQGIELYGWVGAFYMLAATVSIPLWGKLADVRGRKPVLLLGLALFLLGSLTSGLANSMQQLVLFRTIQGLGAGSLQPITFVIIGDLFTLEERGRVQAVFGTIWGIAGMAGPLLGGLLVRYLSWRWCFFINLPFGMFAAALLLARYHEHREGNIAQKAPDLAGAFTLSSAIVLLLAGTGGTLPFLTLPLSAACVVAFLRIEQRAEEPILPLELFSIPAIATGSVASALAGAVMMSWLTFLPLYVQAVRGGTPTEAGSTVAPMLIGWPIAATFAGRNVARIGFRPLVRVGFSLVAFACVASVLALRMHAGLFTLRALMLVYGAGMGFANTALQLAVQEAAPPGRRGVATASGVFFRLIGGAVAVGALGSLLARSLSGRVPEELLNTMLRHESGHALSPQVAQRLSNAMDAGLFPVFLLAAMGAVLAFAAGLRFPALAVSSLRSVVPESQHG